MDEVTEGSVTATWPGAGKLEWNQTHHTVSSPAVTMISSSSFFENQSLLSKPTVPYLSGCTVEKQGLTSDVFPSSALGTTYDNGYHYQPDGTVLPTHPKQNLQTGSAGSCMRQPQSDGFPPVHQEFLDVPHNLLQKLLRGSLKLPKLERSPSFGSTDMSPYFAKGPWIEEAHNCSERKFHLSEQAHQQQIRQPTAATSVPTRPRTRARRGQATDPHSIAERKRREKISNAMKELQELVPTLNKADRMAFVEDVIQYVRFLQVQTKVLIMSRLGTTSSLVESTGQVQDRSEAVPQDLQEYNMTTTEEEIAQLLEEDMGEALRTLQSKGLCMMPIALAALMPVPDTKQPIGLSNAST